MLGYYYVDMMGNPPHSICGAEFELLRSIVALINLLINFRVHLFDNDHLISNKCHAPLILLAQQVPILPPPPTKIWSSKIMASLEDSKVLPFAWRENAPQESERWKALGTDTLTMVEVEAEVDCYWTTCFKVTLVMSWHYWLFCLISFSIK